MFSRSTTRWAEAALSTVTNNSNEDVFLTFKEHLIIQSIKRFHYFIDYVDSGVSFHLDSLSTFTILNMDF